MWEKMIAPIVITVVLVLYYLAFFLGIIIMVDRLWAILLGIVPLAIGGVLIFVCVQRIQEIRSGEEDDLSQY